MNEAEFDRRVRSLEPNMYRAARAILRSDADAADAMQNAVFSAWRKLPGLRDETLFEPWLMRILINASKDMLRRRKRRMETPLSFEEQTFAKDAGRDLDVRAALEQLPDKNRLCVALHHLDGYSVPQIARMLRLPQTTVKGRIREGIKKMKRTLEEETP